MRVEDIDFAISLTNQEGWGYSRADFLRFIRMDPEGTLVACAGSTPVGITTATLYGEVAWIGNVIVRPEERGKGHGRALVEKALEYSRRSGAETCWLNAYTHVVPFYESIGFRTRGRTVRLEGQGRGRLLPEPRLAHASEISAIGAFDRPYFGADRLKVLKEFYHDYGDSFFVWSKDGIEGYIVGAPYSGGVDVAPWVCDPSQAAVAEGLLYHLLASHPDATFGLNVPEENQQAIAILRSLGFETSFSTIRMYYGKGSNGIDPRGVFALGGLEKG
ncbi:MAG: GNAT family N-acetyltransferase [Thermoplasmata archaeon]